MPAATADMAYDAIWSIDWSGARAVTRGIAVARLARGTDTAELVVPPAGARHWRRAAIVDRLAAEIESGQRLLIGFDFAFSFPAATLERLAIAAAAGMAGIRDRVAAICADDPDLYGGRFVAAAPPELFWRAGPRPRNWDEALRITDRRCAAATATRPESALKLVGAKQVGLGALAGMRSLAALEARCGAALAIWPGIAPTPGASAAVEIFPTLFRRAATGRLAKLRDGAALATAMAMYESAPPAGCASGPVDDNAADALISVAGMRATLRRGSAFRVPDDPRIAREGWIFGVPP